MRYLPSLGAWQRTKKKYVNVNDTYATNPAGPPADMYVRIGISRVIGYFYSVCVAVIIMAWRGCITGK
jgi:hypothetical protein